LGLSAAFGKFQVLVLSASMRQGPSEQA